MRINEPINEEMNLLTKIIYISFKILNHNHKQPQNTNPHHDNKNISPTMERA
jgi:hypothetical protein